MAKFNAAEWKKAHRDALSALDTRLAEKEIAVDAARREWKESNYSDAGWANLKAAEKALEQARAEYEKSALIAREKHYCNQYFYSDIEPWEVIGYINEKTLVIRSMNAELTKKGEKALKDSFIASGFCGHYDNEAQEWTITPDERGTTIIVRLHKDGCYHAAGDRGTKFRLSARPVKRYDYNF